jgi:hypothetical protein
MEEKKIEGGGEGGGGGEEGGRRETPELPFLVTNCHVCTVLPQQVWSFQSNLLSFPFERPQQFVLGSIQILEKGF